MANQKKEPVQEQPVLFGMTDYFNSNVLPLSISGGHRTFSKETPRIQNEDEYIALVTAGTGVIYVNQCRFHLSRGTIMCMGPFHNYSIVPDPGSVIELSEARMNCGAYMYILSCPYLKVNELVVPPIPAITRFAEKETVHAERIMKDMRSHPEKNYYTDKLDFLYMMELFGLLMDKFDGQGSAPTFSSRNIASKLRELQEGTDIMSDKKTDKNSRK